jgi:hypothetical protein
LKTGDAQLSRLRQHVLQAFTASKNGERHAVLPD